MFLHVSISFSQSLVWTHVFLELGSSHLKFSKFTMVLTAAYTGQCTCCSASRKTRNTETQVNIFQITNFFTYWSFQRCRLDVFHRSCEWLYEDEHLLSLLRIQVKQHHVSKILWEQDDTQRLKGYDTSKTDPIGMKQCDIGNVIRAIRCNWNDPILTKKNDTLARQYDTMWPEEKKNDTVRIKLYKRCTAGQNDTI